MKILVVLTGGTIGSRINENIIDVDDTSCYRLIEMYKSEYMSVGDGIDKSDYLCFTEFEVISPINILSENLRPKYWKKLYEGITEAIKRNRSNTVCDSEAYDGIIVTHGSDTLAYTSAFLGYVFKNTQIPILVTAANYPLEDERSNGIRNFAACVDFIKESTEGKKQNPERWMGGVFTVFENYKGRSTVYLSTRLREADGYNDRFSSFGDEPFGWMEKGELILNDKDINPSFEMLRLNRKDGFDAEMMNLDFPNEVVLIHTYPGQNYSNFNYGSEVKAVCLVLYHSATTCTGEDDCSVQKLISECRDRGIDVYLCPFKELNTRMYASGSALLTEDVYPLLNIGREAAYVKCLLAYNQNGEEPCKLMNSNQFFEILER